VSRDRVSSSQPTGHGGAGEPAPLYPRLPHGPHRLDRREVLLHQRSRMQGALVEAVARNGYEATSVKQVTALAGVSRRAFYEQFANKEDCFLATFDLIATRGMQRMRHAYLAVDAPLEERLGAAFAQLAAALASDRNAATLVVAEAELAGRAGVARVRELTASGERLLARVFVESAQGPQLPTPIVRGIAGGVRGALASSLRTDAHPEGPGAEPAEIAEGLLRWTLAFEGAPTASMTERMAAGVASRLGEIPTAALAPIAEREHAGAEVGHERERLLRAGLRLAVLGDYRELSVPQIADEAGVPIETFFGLFDDPDACFAAGLDAIAQQLLEIVSDAELRGGEWPLAVRRVMGELLGHLAANPLHAHTLGQGAFSAGAPAVARNLELARAVASALTAGAPRPAESELVVEGVAGAIWHTIGCQATGGRIGLLPVLSDYLAYIVLAPFIGAAAAASVVTEEPR
jgi:TetR/AcrR family transcriptional regulator